MVTFHTHTDDTVWKAISHAKRRGMLDALADGPKSTGEIVELFPTIGRTGVLKHISVLKAADLIHVRREGRVRWNYINTAPIEKMCSRWITNHVRGLQASATRLKRLAEAANQEEKE